MDRYQCLGNHDIVPGQPGVDFQTKVAPIYDSRLYFVGLLVTNIHSTDGTQGTEQLPSYTYDLVGSDWSATFVVLDSDCFISSYQSVNLAVFCYNHHWQIYRTHPYIATPIQQPATMTLKPRSTSYQAPSLFPTPHGNSYNYIMAIVQSQRMK